MFNFQKERIEKLNRLRESGIQPYPHGIHISHSSHEVLALIGDRTKEELNEDITEVVVSGRLMFKNEMGKAGFARIQDDTSVLQIYIRKNSVGDAAFDLWKKLDLGDHVWFRGTLMRTGKGEPSLKAVELKLAAKCIESLPDKHKGLSDTETRARQRYLDLFINAQAKETFRRRSQIVSYIRRYFESRQFMEVETPMMHAIPGGASARPFVTHHNALNMELYMRVAPELYLKRLVVGGFERVFEINRNFRNEGLSTKHNPEFTMLEFYQAYATWVDLMLLTEDLISSLSVEVCGSTSVEYGEHILDFSTPWRRLPMSDGIMEYGEIDSESIENVDRLREIWVSRFPKDSTNPDLPKTLGKWYELYFDTYVEPQLVQPTFVTHYPTEISPLSRRSDSNPEISDRFELFIASREIANGFNELNDPVDQAARFQHQVDARDSGDDEAMFFDADYIKALSYGMPPTAGEGIGIDRLVMLFTQQQSIREVILFPTLRSKQGG
jgi:lysyl-tRNA synthetase, class II